MYILYDANLGESSTIKIDLICRWFKVLITCNYRVISDSDISQTIILWQQVLSKNGKQEICTSRTSSLALFSFHSDYDSLFVWDAAQSMTVSQWRRNGATLREAPQLCGLTRVLQPDHKREQKQLDLCSHTENSREFQRRLSQKKQNEYNML